MASIGRPLSGRAAERKILLRLFDSKKAEFLAVYGRRRVGKTFLIRRFFQDHPISYFEMVGRFDGSQEAQLQIFCEALSSTFHRGAKLRAPANWHDAFQALRAAIEGLEPNKKRPKKVVLFFDELPWIATPRSGCLEELEHFWNAWCSLRDDVVLIVCGSAASWMLRRIVNAKGGLHDRLTQTIRLLPFTLAETKDFFQARKLALSPRDLVELYMIFGGVPHYLDQAERGLSVSQLVDRLCLGKDAPLAQEFERLFSSLFGSDPSYPAVVRALSQKRSGLSRNELLVAARLSSGGGLTTILENLEQGGFVSATIPFGRTSRDKLYRLTDEFCLFHLKWLERQPIRSWHHVRKTPRWQAWAGLAFESVCLEHPRAIERALGISGIRTNVSAWSHEEAQIDMLIERADDVVSIIEIKFSDEPFVISKKYADELRRKIAIFRAQTKLRQAVQLAFVTPYGVAENQYASELVDAQIRMEALLEA